jgi:MFS family permease
MGVFGTAARNRPLLAVVVSFAAFNMVEWGVWVTLFVYAYEVGGAPASGLMALVMELPSALIAPFFGAVIDRGRAGRILFLGCLGLALAVAAVAVAAATEAPSWVVFALAPLVNLGFSIPRPATSALLPAVVRTADELTAANVVNGWFVSGSALAAPALAGVLLSIGGIELTAAAFAIVALIGALVMIPVPGPPPLVRENDVSLIADVREGIAVTVRHPALRLLVGLQGAQWVLMGALDVLYVVLAFDVLDMGGSGAGFLSSAFGAGAIVGSAAAAVLVARRRLAPALTLGILVAAVSLVLLGISPSVAAAFGLIAVVGLGRTVADVTGTILLQRAAPPAALAKVFALLESVLNLGLVIGALFVPFVIGLAGPQAALVATGAVFVALVALSWRGLRGVDDAADVPQVEIQLLQSIPLFAPLPPPQIEGVARALVPVSAETGDVLIREGQEGERYFAVADGEVAVDKLGHEVARLRRGDGFGEISLIRDVPCTATVTATADSLLYALEKDRFILAVTGHQPAATATDRLIDRRLEELEAETLGD